MLVAEGQPAFSNLAAELMLRFPFASRHRSFANEVSGQLFSGCGDECDDCQ
jgi:hypothetical protein